MFSLFLFSHWEITITEYAKSFAISLPEDVPEGIDKINLTCRNILHPMPHRIFIKRSVSLLLLLVFAFSITPKQWIHKIAFHHKDVFTECNDGISKAHLHQTGFHCELDNLVVLSPFTSDISITKIEAPLVHTDYYTYNENNHYPIPVFFFDLRGPPAII